MTYFDQYSCHNFNHICSHSTLFSFLFYLFFKFLHLTISAFTFKQIIDIIDINDIFYSQLS